MRRFKSPRQAQRFLAAHDQINTIFKPRRYRLTANSYLVPAWHNGVQVAGIGPLQLERGEDFRGLSAEPAKGEIDTAPQDRLFGGDGVIGPARRPMIAKNAFDDLCRELPMHGGFLQGVDTARADHIGPCIQCGQVIGAGFICRFRVLRLKRFIVLLPQICVYVTTHLRD